MTYYPGQGFTIYTDFRETLNAPPHYALRRNSDSALVQEGIAEQDPSQPARWSAQIVLPEVATEGIYTLDWEAQSNEQTLKNTERLTVGERKSEYFEIDTLVMEDQPIMDVLSFEADQTPTNVRVVIRDEESGIVAVGTVEQSDVAEPTYIGRFSEGLQTRNGAFAVYVIEWVFSLNGQETREYHFVYVANHKILIYVNELRRMIDKAQLQHDNPALRYNDVDLVAFLNLGLQTINSSPPTQTAYTLSAIPASLYAYVLKAAAVEALDSRYLAEAEAAFSFNSGSVTLDVDRTAFLESARERYKTALEDLRAVKKNIVMTTGGTTAGRPAVGNSAGVLIFARSPSLDYTGLSRSLYTNLRPGNRAILYDELLGNL